MARILTVFSVFLVLSSAGYTRSSAAGVYVKTDIPPNIEKCITTGLRELWEIELNDRQALFEYFLNNIDVEQFGAYNFKRAWRDWGQNSEIKRLALYEYFSLMMGRRSEHDDLAEAFDARLADRPLVRGNDVYHIIVRADFSDGSSTTIVVFTVGCQPFGFMYGGANLRAFVNPDMIERLYRSGERAPF